MTVARAAAAALAAALIAALAAASPAAGRMVLEWGMPGALDRAWREIRYAGATRYAVVAADSAAALRAEGEGRNSALVRPVEVDPRGLSLAWRWRVLRHPEGADPAVRGRDDRAAAVIVIVRRSWLPWRTRALLYMWSPSRPAGEWAASPYSGEVRTLVLRTEPADSLWRAESRDLAADLARAFGAIPERIEAIGVISDTDDTGAAAAAEFGAIVVRRAP